MIDDWKPVVALPNVQASKSIGGKSIALASLNDPRVKAITQSHPNLNAFLKKFSDAFGVRRTPSLIIVKSNAAKSLLTAEAIAGFRDSISLSVIPYNRALTLIYPQRSRIVYSNTFSFYPWMTDKKDEHLILNNPALMALHVVKEFKGQTSPEIPTLTFDSNSVDLPIFEELIFRWHRRYTAHKPDWEDISLFRSLNMANTASLLPAVDATTIYDIGRSIGLWISALEILAHPRNGNSNHQTVGKLLDRMKWEMRPSYERRHLIKFNNTRVPLYAWLLAKLYQIRHDFMHGNEIQKNPLAAPNGKGNFFDYAALLYRMALASFMHVYWTQKPPPFSDTDRFTKYYSEESQFKIYQSAHEQALQTVKKIQRKKKYVVEIN